VTAVAAPHGAGAATGERRLGLSTALLGAFVVTMLRPASWAVGLLGFLAGGGILLVAWPIVVLPTPTGLQNLLAEPIVSLAFGSVSESLLLAIAAGIAAAAGLVAVCLLVGAWAERQGIGLVLEAAPDDALDRPPSDLAGAPGAGRIALLRLLSLAPLAVVAAVAWQAVYDAVYHELVLPGDLAVPLPVRVVGEVPGQVVGIGLAWLLSDTAASVGVRRLVLERRPVLVAWLLGWSDLVRRPRRVLPTALFGVAVVALPVAPALLAAGIGWSRLREIMVAGSGIPLTLGATLVWVAIWMGGLVLAGVASAVRAAAWTLEIPVAGSAGAATGSPDALAGASPG